jgi:hypothetical protein
MHLLKCQSSSKDRQREMRVLASPDAVEYVREHGGSLYVWADVNCPGCSVPFLSASTDRPKQPSEFSRFPGEDFDLLYSDGDIERPCQLIVDVSGWRKERLAVRTPDFWIKEWADPDPSRARLAR